jgi:hypothetical protein
VVGSASGRSVRQSWHPALGRAARRTIALVVALLAASPVTAPFSACTLSALMESRVVAGSAPSRTDTVQSDGLGGHACIGESLLEDQLKNDATLADSREAPPFFTVRRVAARTLVTDHFTRLCSTVLRL